MSPFCGNLRPLCFMALAAILWTACSKNSPSGVTPTKPGDLTQGWYHKVQIGDTVEKIAQRYGRTNLEIAQANNLGNPAYFREGMYLWIPPQGKVTVVDRMPRPEDSSNPFINQQAQDLPVRTTGAAPLDPSYFQSMSSKWSMEDAPDPSARKLGFVWPVDVTSVSDVRVANLGIDLHASKGTPVKAVGDGKVVAVLSEGGTLRGYGNTIFLEHPDGYTSVYAHNEANLVKTNDAVRRGQVIARVGSTDSETPKLHFEIRRGNNAEPVNPLRLLPQM